MTIEAPISRYKKQNLLIAIAVMVGLSIWCIYDGFYNEKFIREHQDEEGNPKGWLVVNQKAPPYLIAGAIAASVYFFAVRGKKVVADESGLTAGGKTIAYDAIEKIDKTHFDTKGYFVMTYKDQQGQSQDIKLSDRTYDNMGLLLDHLVAKIS